MTSWRASCSDVMNDACGSGAYATPNVCEMAANKDLAISSVSQRVSSIRTCTMDPYKAINAPPSARWKRNGRVSSGDIFVPRITTARDCACVHRFAHICLCVCHIRALAFENIDLETSLLVYGYAYRSRSSIKVIS